ncbi:MAG: 4Fe-4S binding protein [Candidatus Helarchaeota archaeon]
MERRLKVRLIRLVVQVTSFFLFNLGFFVMPLLYWMEGWILPIDIGFGSPYTNVSGFFNIVEMQLIASVIPFFTLGITFIIGVIAGRACCAWICPMGLINDIVSYIPFKKAKFSQELEETAYLLPLILLAAFIGYAVVDGFSFLVSDFVGMEFPSISYFQYGVFTSIDPYNTLFSTIPWMIIRGEFPNVLQGVWDFIARNPVLIVQVILVVVFIGLNLVIQRAFCRYICPTGTCMGFFGRYKLIGLKRDPTHCNKCKKCEEVCPMNVPILKEPFEHIGHHSCDMCLECYGACPEKALKFRIID